MASRRKKLSFLIQRFRGFWNQYKRSKRGVLGIGIIAFFGIVAIFAPVIAPMDPLNPRMTGYYPAGAQPKIADKLCVPIWYKSLLGAQSLSETMVLMEDHEFSSLEAFDTVWKWYGGDAPYKTSAEYSLTEGTHDDDGCVELSFRREESENATQSGKVNITLTAEFYYPYQNSPRSFWWHYSLRLENRTSVTEFPIVTEIGIRRGNEPEAIQIKSKRITRGWVESKWYSTSDTTTELDTVEAEIFTNQGNYTAEFVFSLIDPGDGDIDVTVYVDNLQMILYGESYGLLGTTSIPQGYPRDLFTMLVHGTRISFMIGLLTAFFSVLIGLVVGLVSGYVRGIVDEGLMRFADFLMVLPGLPLLIVLVTVLGASIWNIVGVLIFMGWMGFSRSVRSMVLSLRERPFVESAKASGAGTGYIIYRHILPNVFALVYVSLATSVPGAIVAEASLAWLGLGDINIPSWGIMLYDFSRTQTAIVTGIGEYWFWVIPPGIAIALMAMAFILMGFSLDEILNPRLRRRR